MEPDIGSNQRPGGLGIRFLKSAGQSFPRREEGIAVKSLDLLSMRLSTHLVLASASLVAAAADTTVRK